MFLVLRDPLLSTFVAKVARVSRQSIENPSVFFYVIKEFAVFSAAGAYRCNFLPVFAASRVRGPERRAVAPETRGEA